MVGIYKIENLINNKVYIGQSYNLKRRLVNHKSKLKNNNHANIYLQRSVNKHGLTNFTFEIIYTMFEEIVTRKVIDELNLNKYNLLKSGLYRLINQKTKMYKKWVLLNI